MINFREMTDEDRFYLKAAYSLAMGSPDPSTQNGAVIVSEWGGMVGGAANTFPAGVKQTEERLVRPLKYSFVEHAERGAIFDTAKRYGTMRGTTMYCPWYACSDCARAIIGVGIREVIGHKAMFDKPDERWRESIKIAFEMFDEAGVKYTYVDGQIGEPTLQLKFDGQLWIP